MCSNGVLHNTNGGYTTYTCGVRMLDAENKGLAAAEAGGDLRGSN